MAKWHPNEAGASTGEKAKKPYADTPFYTRNRFGQYELWKPEEVPLLQRVLTFLKDLRLSDFD